MGIAFFIILTLFVIISGSISWTGLNIVYASTYANQHALLFIALTAISIPFIIAFALADKKGENFDSTIGWLTRNDRAVVWGLAVGVVLALIVCVWALRAFPNSADEYVYTFQADTLLAGRLWNPLSALHEHFSSMHIFEKDDKWVGQYPPGWPLMIAGAKLTGIPQYVVSPICATLLVLVFASLCRDVAGPLGAVVGAALMAVSSFFLLNGASYYSHIPTALFAVLFVLYGLRYLDNPSKWSALMVGGALGAIGIIRPYSAVLFALPFAAEVLIRSRREDRSMAIWFIVGGLPFLIGLMIYNFAITGHPFLLVTNWGYPLAKLGFHSRDVDGVEANLLDASGMALRRVLELAEWTAPLIVYLYAFAISGKFSSRTFRFYDFIFPTFIAGYLLFPAMGGNRYGPRYYFEAYPFLILTIVTATIPYLTSNAESIKARFLAYALAMQVVLAIIIVPIHTFNYHRIVNERMELYDAVRNEKLSHAVVIVRAGTGSISPVSPGSPISPMDLTRNGINPVEADVIYALYNPDPGWLYATGHEHEAAKSDQKSLEELVHAFPDRTFYEWTQSEGRGSARLQRLASPM